ELKDGSPLRLLIGDVERREESLRSGRGTPEGKGEADRKAPTERPTGRLHEPAYLLDDDVVGLCRKHVRKHAKLLLNGRGIRGEAIKGDQRGERGEDGKQREERAACQDDREFIAPALGPHPLDDLPPATQGNVVRPPRVAAIRVRLGSHVGEKNRSIARDR